MNAFASNHKTTTAKRRGHCRKTWKSRRHGMTMAEVSISTLLVSLVVVTSLKTVGAVIRHRGSTADDQRAFLLAEQLMSEILENEYDEPDDSPNFGRETGENGSNRLNYDDVDDYHNLSSAPKSRDGTVVSGLNGWRRDVVVEWVDPADPTSTVGSDQGAKRITVSVLKNGKLLATLRALRTDHD